MLEPQMLCRAEVQQRIQRGMVPGTNRLEFKSCHTSRRKSDRRQRTRIVLDASMCP